VAVLVREANAGSPEASGNFWVFLQGLPDEARPEVTIRPERVVEWTDFSEGEFEGLDLGPEFSANLAIFVRARFIGCKFTNCKFTQCDFTEASFVNCQFSNVSFEHCDGPVFFDDCRADSNTRFAEISARQLPAWHFSSCAFSEGARLEQTTFQ